MLFLGLYIEMITRKNAIKDRQANLYHQVILQSQITLYTPIMQCQHSRTILKVSLYIGTKHLKIDYSPQLVTEKTIELERSVKSIKNEAVVLIITPCRDQVAVIESNVSNIERLCKIGKTTKCTGQNLLKHNNTLVIMKCT